MTLAPTLRTISSRPRASWVAPIVRIILAFLSEIGFCICEEGTTRITWGDWDWKRESRVYSHEDDMTRKRLLHYWPSVRAIHRRPMDSPPKGQVRRNLNESYFKLWPGAWSATNYIWHQDLLFTVSQGIIFREKWVFAVRKTRLTMNGSWGHLNINMPSYQGRDSHYKDETVSRQSQLCDGNLHTRNIYWDGARPDVLVHKSGKHTIMSETATLWRLCRHWCTADC